MGLTRFIAKRMVDNVIQNAKKSDREEQIVLIKHPGNEDAESLDISIKLKLSTHTAPMYVGKIIREVAEECDLSFDDLVSLSKTFMDLMDEVTDCEHEDLLKKEDTNEDQQA